MDDILKFIGYMTIIVYFVFLTVSSCRAWDTYDTDEANDAFEFKKKGR